MISNKPVSGPYLDKRLRAKYIEHMSILPTIEVYGRNLKLPHSLIWTTTGNSISVSPDFLSKSPNKLSISRATLANKSNLVQYFKIVKIWRFQKYPDFLAQEGD